MFVGSEAKKRVTQGKGGSGAVVRFTLVVVAGFFSVPFIAHYTKGTNLTAQKDPLNASQTRRGAYANSGSCDAGADPNWDLSTGTYRGRRGPRVTESKHVGNR